MNDPQIDPRELANTPTKLALNLTYPALKALIGGDTEAELHIRQQIVDRFSKDHLKPLVNDELFRQSYNALLTGLRQEIADKIGKYVSSGWNQTAKIELNKDVKDQLQRQCKEMAEIAIMEAYNAAIAKMEDGLAAKIDEHLERRIDMFVTLKVKERIDKKLKELVA